MSDELDQTSCPPIETGPVWLTPIERKLAEVVGTERCNRARERGLQDKHGLDPGKGLLVSIEGAAGEVAFCKLTNRYWPAHVDTFKSVPDVPPFEIRTVEKPWYNLLVRGDDPDDRPYVLVDIITWPTHFRVNGWMWGHEAKQPQWVRRYNDREPAWFAPREFLRTA